MNHKLKQDAEDAIRVIRAESTSANVDGITIYINHLESQVIGLTSSEAITEMNLHIGEIWTCHDGEVQFRISSADHLEFDNHPESEQSDWKPTHRLLAWEQSATDWRKVEQSL